MFEVNTEPRMAETPGLWVLALGGSSIHVKFGKMVKFLVPRSKYQHSAKTERQELEMWFSGLEHLLLLRK